jgi:hypothetical protein
LTEVSNPPPIIDQKVTQLFCHSYTYTQKLAPIKRYDVPLQNNNIGRVRQDWPGVCKLVSADFVLRPAVHTAFLSCRENKMDEQVRIRTHFPHSSYFAGRVLSDYSFLSCSKQTPSLSFTLRSITEKGTLNSNAAVSFTVEPSFKVSLHSNGFEH